MDSVDPISSESTEKWEGDMSSLATRFSHGCTSGLRALKGKLPLAQKH